MAIPAGLEAVPVQMTTDMRAACRMKVQFAGLVPVGGDLFETPTQDCTLTRLDLPKGGDFTGCHILREILWDGQVLA
jgi:hypothetical protein